MKLFPPRAGAFRHPHAELLGALAQAQAALQTPAFAQALSGLIDFDLPPGTPSATDAVQVKAAAPLYFASELERAGLLPTAELVAGLFASGAVVQPLGPAAQLLHAFWRARGDRLSEEERLAIFARVFEAPHFGTLMAALCNAIVAQADGHDIREEVQLASHAQALGGFLAQRTDPMAAIAARDIVQTLHTALAFLRDRLVQTAFGVRDLWALVGIVDRQRTQAGGEASAIGAGGIQSALDRGRNGQAVLLWLADHLAGDTQRIAAASPEGAALIAAATRWLAASPARAPTGPAHPPLRPAAPAGGIALALAAEVGAAVPIAG